MKIRPCSTFTYFKGFPLILELTTCWEGLVSTELLWNYLLSATSSALLWLSAVLSTRVHFQVLNAFKKKIKNFPHTSSSSNWNTRVPGHAWRCAMHHIHNFKSQFPDSQCPCGFSPSMICLRTLPTGEASCCISPSFSPSHLLFFCFTNKRRWTFHLSWS